jgi:hypothetical protein
LSEIPTNELVKKLVAAAEITTFSATITVVSTLSQVMQSKGICPGNFFTKLGAINLSVSGSRK